MRHSRIAIRNHPDPLPAAGEDQRYQLDLRVRNCRIVDALTAMGHTPMSFIRKYELRVDEFYGLVNMTLSPWKTTGHRGSVLEVPVIRRSAEILMAETGKSFDELFNDQQANRPLSINRHHVALSEDQVRQQLPQVTSEAASGVLLPAPGDP